jgi:nucleotide sugar dehydrogenase
MKIGIIGMGHVGATMQALFQPHADIVTFDLTDTKPYPHDDLAECDFAIVCVNTPPDPDGACDTSNVIDAVKRLPTQRVLLKSTVSPGTTDDLAEATGKTLCFSPEYVGESTYHQPFWADSAASVPFVIFGGPPDARSFFVDAFLPVLGPSKVYFQCTAREAEVIKYMENSFFATKVTFVNEFFEICRVLGADWHTVREGWLLDPRVEPMHTAVFSADRGYAGKCLPKDTDAIIHAATAAGYRPHLLAEVVRSNARFRAGS